MVVLLLRLAGKQRRLGLVFNACFCSLSEMFLHGGEAKTSQLVGVSGVEIIMKVLLRCSTKMYRLLFMPNGALQSPTLVSSLGQVFFLCQYGSSIDRP